MLFSLIMYLIYKLMNIYNIITGKKEEDFKKVEVKKLWLSSTVIIVLLLFVHLIQEYVKRNKFTFMEKLYSWVILIILERNDKVAMKFLQKIKSIFLQLEKLKAEINKLVKNYIKGP